MNITDIVHAVELSGVLILVYIIATAIFKSVAEEVRGKRQVREFNASPAGEMLSKLNAGECPDCGSNDLLAGPRGGMAQNILCAKCKTEFWYAPPFTPYRMTRTPEERIAVYGI